MDLGSVNRILARATDGGRCRSAGTPPNADFCLGSAHPAHSHLDVGLQNQRNTDRPTYGAPSPLAGTGKTARVQQKLLLVVKRRQHSPPSQVSYML